MQLDGGLKPLPAKVENRLRELVALGEFNAEECEQCRQGYWNARDDWHTILINCYARAQDRAERASAQWAKRQPGDFRPMLRLGGRAPR